MENNHLSFSLDSLSLGKRTKYCSNYAPGLLQAVPRELNRFELNIVEQQPFTGADIWNAYELSWLNSKGKPIVALARFVVNANSPNIVESKSLKLYLNSYNQSHFASMHEVRRNITEDLSKLTGTHVKVDIFSAEEKNPFRLSDLPGQCLDGLDIEVESYELDSSLLVIADKSKKIDEVVHSHLLKSNCLITNQPDWASVIIRYRGEKIDHESLLKYLISFRMHNEFHEQCVERIFMDIYNKCCPDALSVQALYTRRGGIDINPYRYSGSWEEVPVLRVNRQ